MVITNNMAVLTMSTIKDKNEQGTNDFENNIDYEIQLLYAMQGHKPVGIGKYFQMSCICEKLQQNTDRDVNSAAIWAYLEKLYDLQQLDDNESIPFPNEETEFSLPDSEFQTLKQKKLDTAKQAITEHRQSSTGASTPVQTKSIPQSRKIELNTPLKESQKNIPAVLKDTPPSSSKIFVEKNKKESHQRRDSTNTQPKESQKSSSKKDSSSTPTTKKESGEKKSQSKARSSISSNISGNITKKSSDDDSKNKEDLQMTPKRTTRGSLKPEELTTERNSRKSQSPLTIVNSANKRRRI